MQQQYSVMISSTVLDLPQHREAVHIACHRQNVSPRMMEHLGVADVTSVEASLKMVDESDIYLLVLGTRYGTILPGYTESITELEFNRALERNKACLAFLMDTSKHPVVPDDVDVGEKAAKLHQFRDRVQDRHKLTGWFHSADDLRGLVVDSLSKFKVPGTPPPIHPISAIARAPDAYVAHPYTLLQTGSLTGRQRELNILTNWISRPDQTTLFSAHTLAVVGLGGMGKSALTWKWFNDVAPRELPNLSGRMWWSFYESDASFENFAARGLAYATGRSLDEVLAISPYDCEQLLLRQLDREPFLIVLDGLERLLLAYARLDAARLADDDLDQRTANFVAQASGLPSSAAQSFTGQHRLRHATDPRVGSFLHQLASVRASRILISTRLFPADLQTATLAPLPGSYPLFLSGLRDEDAIDLWRAFGVSGTRDALLELFHRFDNYPLLIRALAGEVAAFRPAPGDFDRWKAANPKFDPFKLALQQVKSHVLEFALKGLDPNCRRVLETIAGFRMPASYATLQALFVGDDALFETDSGLDSVLTMLEDRGLVGWDRRSNRYDLHPVVRGVTWSMLTSDHQQAVYATLQSHFEAIPQPKTADLTSMDELTPSIELFNSLAGRGLYADAFDVLNDRLVDGVARFSGWRQLIEMTSVLNEPQVRAQLRSDQVMLLQLALGLMGSIVGNLDEAIVANTEVAESLAVEAAAGTPEPAEPRFGALFSFSNLWIPLLLASGAVGGAAALMQIVRDAVAFDDATSSQPGYHWGRCALAWVDAVRGAYEPARHLVTSVLETIVVSDDVDRWFVRQVWSLSTQVALWARDPTAQQLADAAAAAAREDTLMSDLALHQAMRLRACAALQAGDLATADALLPEALARSRGRSDVTEELQILVALAQLRLHQQRLDQARSALDDVWFEAERGPYRLVLADACSVLARIEIAAGNREAAVASAKRAFSYAWCDGPPDCYRFGLDCATQLLADLSEPLPAPPEIMPSAAVVRLQESLERISAIVATAPPLPPQN